MDLVSKFEKCIEVFGKTAISSLSCDIIKLLKVLVPSSIKSWMKAEIWLFRVCSGPLGFIVRLTSACYIRLYLQKCLA